MKKIVIFLAVAVLSGFAAADADACVAVTGVAGPDGGTDEKPVGLVYVGIYFLGDIEILELKLDGTREEIRNECINSASKNILRKIKNS